MVDTPLSPRKQHALELFAGLPRRYDRPAPRSASARTRAGGAALVAAVAAPRASASSTSRPAPGWSPSALAQRCGCRGRRARPERRRCSPRRQARLARRPRAARGRIKLVEGEAERLPFADGEFDAPDLHLPAALRRGPGRDAARAGAGRQARRARSGCSSSASRGRAVAACAVARSTRASACRCSGRLRLAGVGEVGRFLGPSIEDFYARHARTCRGCGARPGSAASRCGR